MFKFIVSQSEVEELGVNTKEVFKDRWVSEVPSQNIAIGYSFDVDTLEIDIKYEDNEDGRITAEELESDARHGATLPAVYGAVVRHHRAKSIRVGDIVRNCVVHVNQPDGMYRSIKKNFCNTIYHHAVDGDLFTLEGDTYVKVSDSAIEEILESHVGEYDLGIFIPERYLVRWYTNGDYSYHPVKYAFFPGAHAIAAKYGTDQMWMEKARELVDKYLNVPISKEEPVLEEV